MTWGCVCVFQSNCLMRGGDGGGNRGLMDFLNKTPPA